MERGRGWREGGDGEREGDGERKVMERGEGQVMERGRGR